MPGRELGGVQPVRGSPPVVEQAGRGQREGTGAHRDHAGAPGDRRAQRGAHLLAGILQGQVAGNHHGVRGDQLVQAVRGVNGVPRRAWHRPGGGGADGEAVSLGLPAVAENLRRYSQVEGLDGRQRECGHGMHGHEPKRGQRMKRPLTLTHVSQVTVSTGSR